MSQNSQKKKASSRKYANSNKGQEKKIRNGRNII